MKYKAVVAISTPQDGHEYRRIVSARDKGEPLPMEERKMHHYEAGEALGYVPDESVEWLLEQGLIEEDK